MSDQNQNKNDTGTGKESDDNVSFWSMVHSVIAGIFGVQSDKNREKDFTKGDAGQFIALGIIATVILLIIMFMIVSSVLESAGQ